MNIYDVLPNILDRASHHVIVECGAHDGSDSLHLRAMFPKATIFSFEPDPRNLAAIRSRGIDKVVGLVPAAVGDRDGYAEFHQSSANLGAPHPEWLKGEQWAGSSSLKRPTGHLTSLHPWCEFKSTLQVPIVTLDTFRRRAGLAAIDLIWADVQGAEDLLIAGAQETLRDVRYLYTEYADRPEYEGQISLEEIQARLPARWEVVHKFPFDVLLRNVNKVEGRGA